jgi:type 1 glutamine amidotransferase
MLLTSGKKTVFAESLTVTTVPVVSLATFLLALTVSIQPASADLACRVLIVTGQDKYHDWRRTTPALVEILHEDPRLQVDVLSELRSLSTVDLDPYGAVVIHFKNEDPDVPGRKAFDNLRRYVADGGGLVLVHFACGAFQEFKLEYAKLVGRVWFGLKPLGSGRQHDPRGPFRVQLARPSHPITTGMLDFDTDDELYTCLEGDPPIEVIATARSKLDGKIHPMAFLYQVDKGRVFNCTLGHDVRALRIESVAELYRRGCAWSAGRAPTPLERRPDAKN